MERYSFAQDNLIIREFLNRNQKEILKQKRKRNANACYDGSLNYSKIYVPSNANKVSVIGNYVTAEDDFRNSHKYAKLRYDEQNQILKTDLYTGKDWDTFYYGATPIIESSLIIKEIRNKLFQGEDGVYKFVCKYADNFMIHAAYENVLPALSQYIVVAMLEKFGVKIICNSLIEHKISSLLDKNVKLVEEQKDKTVFKCIYVYGCPSQSFFKTLEGVNFEVNDQILVPSSKGLSFEKCFKQHGIIHNLKGNAYYNGVLLRALRIDQECDAVNQGVVALKINFERTTYASIDALSNNFTDSCFLQKGVRREIIKLLKEDDEFRLQKLTKSEDVSEESFLANLNEYLSQTVSAVQVGVSANIVSSDGFLLFGQREKNTIDENLIYPSVNGNAEIADKNVAFYKMSTKEDYPDININNAFRIDFNGEISRELLAELNIDSVHKHWDCYGVCLSGTTASYLQKKEVDIYREVERRLHFNVLFEQQLDVDLYTIKQKQKNATEKYENQRIIGVKYSFFESMFSLSIRKLSNAIRIILALKDFITTAIALIVFFVALNSAEQEMSTWITAVFSCLFILQSIINLYSDFSRKKVWLISPKRDILVEYVKKDKILDKALLGKEMHPVVPILLMCYINSHIKK